MTIEITFDDALRFVREAIADKGEGYIYVNPDGEAASADFRISCFYWNEGRDEPSCIVGQVLHRAGLSGDVIQQDEGTIARHYLNTKEDQGHISVSGKTVSFLSNLQSRQDEGTSWGGALEGALDHISDF